MLRLTLLMVIGLCCVEGPTRPPPPPAHCILALPPAQVARLPTLTILYCRFDPDWCASDPIAPGWLYVAGPVACD